VLIRPSQDVTDLVGAMEAKHPLVASHCRRVAAYGVLLATHYGLPESTVDAIRIHDHFFYIDFSHAIKKKPSLRIGKAGSSELFQIVSAPFYFLS